MQTKVKKTVVKCKKCGVLNFTRYTHNLLGYCWWCWVEKIKQEKK